MRRRLALVIAGALLPLLACCTTPIGDAVQDLFPEEVSAEPDTPVLPTLTEPAKGYRYPDIRNTDGTITRILWMRPGVIDPLIKPLMAQHPDGKAVTIASAGGAEKDPNKAPTNAGWTAVSGNDALMVTGTLEAVDAATKLVGRILTSVPQIEIEARVVEVTEDDQFAFGIDWFLLDRQDQDYDPNSPDPQGDPLDPSARLFNRARLGGGIPPLPGFNPGGFLPDTLIELGTIQRNIQLDLLIQALKQFTKVDVMNSPRVLVRSGHTAVLTAGEDVPFFALQTSGNNTTVSTQFKKVAVNLEVLPRLIDSRTINLVVSTSVDAITSFSTVISAGVAVTNPIITTRGVTTNLDVEDGATVVLGGLITTQQTEVDEKVPILGDIPILDFFFTATNRQATRSNLIFFIRPKLITPSGIETQGLILPPEPGEMPGDTGGGDGR